MNKKNLLLGMLIIGTIIIACDNGTETDKNISALNGTWCQEYDEEFDTGERSYLKLNNGKYETYSTIHEVMNPGGGKGIYNLENNVFTMKATHYYIENEDSLFEDYTIAKDRWYSENELLNAIGLSNNDFQEEFGWIFEPFVYSYVVNEPDLIFTLMDFPTGYPFLPRDEISFTKL